MRDCVDAMRLLADPRRPQPTYAKFQVVLGVRVRVRSGLANQALAADARKVPGGVGLTLTLILTDARKVAGGVGHGRVGRV